MSGGVLHLVGLHVQVGPLRRQRCSWCGQLLVDDDLSRMAWTLHPCTDCDGTGKVDPDKIRSRKSDDCRTCNGTGEIDPGPPGAWPVGAVVEVVGDMDDFRAMRVVPEDEWPESTEVPGERRLPDGCCALLDPAVTT